MAKNFLCPECGSADIWENNVVHVRLRVNGWDEEGEPTDFYFPWREVDDTIRTVTESEAPRWYCNGCGKEFDSLEVEITSKAPAIEY